ncbi:putative ribonuclease H-like domain-containing protein [Tanacetum coccineum]|uniref:Ribonuclease H-like domain-containing protein n=1 Tax=Tanacetum coccineum TaxID=301880 RepID=A0ABQ5CEH4_9ASTR
MDKFCREKCIKREYSVARTPQQNGVAERKNRTLIEAARTMLADSKLPTTFWTEAVSTACYVQNRVLIVKPHNKTPYELFRGIKPTIGFMKPFGCHVIILNTLDKLDKFNGKSDEGFFVGYSLSSKAFRDASYFNDASLKSVADAQIQDQDGTHDDCSLQDNGTDDQQVNTASPEVNTGSREVSTAVPEVNTATPEDLMGPIPTTEDTQVEDQEIELGNISPSYAVSSTPHTRIHKDHPIDHVIGDVQSSVQTRRMTTSYSELGFLGAIYEGKTHQDLHTCLFACFLSQEEPKRVSKALSDPAWVEAMQDRGVLMILSVLSVVGCCVGVCLGGCDVVWLGWCVFGVLCEGGVGRVGRWWVGVSGVVWRYGCGLVVGGVEVWVVFGGSVVRCVVRCGLVGVFCVCGGLGLRCGLGCCVVGFCLGWGVLWFGRGCVVCWMCGGVGWGVGEAGVCVVGVWVWPELRWFVVGFVALCGCGRAFEWVFGSWCSV